MKNVQNNITISKWKLLFMFQQLNRKKTDPTDLYYVILNNLTVWHGAVPCVSEIWY